VQIHAGDSLAYLKPLADQPPAGLEFLDLLYLDFFDATSTTCCRAPSIRRVACTA
jgi:hypothetical protein